MDADSSLLPARTQTFTSEENAAFEQFIRDVCVFMNQMILSGTNNTQYFELYTKAYNYCTDHLAVNRSAQLYQHSTRIARSYVGNINMQSTELVGMLKGAEIALNTLYKVFQYLDKYYVGFKNLKPLRDCFDELIRDKKLQYCEENECTMDELNTRIESAIVVALSLSDYDNIGGDH
jgi:hypothetical protein